MSEMQTSVTETIEVQDISIHAIIRECKLLDRNMTQNLEGFVRNKFRRGCVLKPVVGSDGIYGEAAVEQIATEIGLSDATLYEEHAFARRYDYSEERLEAEFEELRKMGRKINYSVFRKQLNPAKNPEVVGGKENHREQTLQNIERLGQEVETANELYRDEDQEVEGVVEKGVEVLTDSVNLHLEKREGLPIKQGVRFESELFRRFTTTRDCCVTGKPGPSDPHHVIPKGRGGTHASDAKLVPLSREMHDEVTAFPDSFEDRHSVDLGVKAWENVEAFIRAVEKGEI